LLVARLDRRGTQQALLQVRRRRLVLAAGIQTAWKTLVELGPEFGQWHQPGGRVGTVLGGEGAKQQTAAKEKPGHGVL
jgi:hypothetical protein